MIPVTKFVKDYHKVPKSGDKEPNIYGGVVSMGKGNNLTMKGLSSEESEEVLDDEIQSSSEDPEYSQKMSDGQSAGEISENKSVKSGINVRGNRSAGSDEGLPKQELQQKDDEFEQSDEDEQKLDWQQIFLQEKMMGEP